MQRFPASFLLARDGPFAPAGGGFASPPLDFSLLVAFGTYGDEAFQLFRRDAHLKQFETFHRRNEIPEKQDRSKFSMRGLDVEHVERHPLTDGRVYRAKLRRTQMGKLQIRYLVPALAIVGAHAVQADHNSVWGEGWANMPNDIHNARVDTRDEDTDEFIDFVRMGSGADSVNRFLTDDTDTGGAAGNGGTGGQRNPRGGRS